MAGVPSGLDAKTAGWAGENLPEPPTDLVELGAALNSSMRAGTAYRLSVLLCRSGPPGGSHVRQEGLQA